MHIWISTRICKALDLEEFHWVAKKVFGFSKEETRLMFEHFDVDKDHGIEYVEFMDFIHEYNEAKTLRARKRSR